jgi:hypothetical protein
MTRLGQTKSKTDCCTENQIPLNRDDGAARGVEHGDRTPTEILEMSSEFSPPQA